MLLASLALLMVGVGPQDPPAPGAEVTQVPGLVVEGRPTEDLAREFVRRVAAPPTGAPVARWSRPLCVAAENLPPAAAAFLVERLSSVALDVGLEIGEDGCDPLVLVIATTDGAAIARGLVERRRHMLAPGNRIQSRSRSELERFAQGRRPVRWWHVSTAVDPVSGANRVRRPADDNVNASTGSLIENGPVVRGADSLMVSAVRQDLRRAIIIIDFDELGEVNFDQLADYVAFVALAQVDPEADTSAFPTILNLFADPTTPGLTAWDRAYLQGLYGSDDSARGAAARDAALRREMLRALEREDAATAGE